MNLWEKKKLVLICFLIMVGAVIALFGWETSTVGEQADFIKQDQRPQTIPPPVLVSVYISGAVKKPGIYEVPAGIRVVEALKLAGGITPEALLHKVNLAKKCKDGLHIHVPFLTQSRSKSENFRTADPNTPNFKTVRTSKSRRR